MSEGDQGVLGMLSRSFSPWTTRDKGAVCGWKKEVLHLHGHGQGSAQQCKLSGGINPAPEGCLVVWGGHQVVAQSSGWATCLGSPAWEGLVEPRLHLSIPGTFSKAPSSPSLTFLHCPWPKTLGFIPGCTEKSHL